MTVASHVVDEFKRGNIVVIIGPDLDESITGIFNRKQLADKLALKMGIPPTKSLAEMAQLYLPPNGSRFAINNFLCTEIKDQFKKTQKVHTLVAQLVKTAKVSSIISCSYDTLFERALRENQVSTNVVISDADLSFSNDSECVVVKAYSDCDHKDHLVITEEDQLLMLQNVSRTKVVAEIRRLIAYNAVFVLGLHVSDSLFKSFYLENSGQRFSKGGFIVTKDINEVERRMWEGKGLKIIAEDELTFLENLLTLLRIREKQLQSEPSSNFPNLSKSYSGKESIEFFVEFVSINGAEYEARSNSNYTGQSKTRFVSPFSRLELATVLKLIENNGIQNVHWNKEQMQILESLELLDKSGNLSDSFLKIIGKRLFQSLFIGDLGASFHTVYNQSKRQNQPLHLIFKFDEDSVFLARYPWELLSTPRTQLLATGVISLVRYISFPEPAIQAKKDVPNSPLKVLFLQPRPINETQLTTQVFDEFKLLETKLNIRMHRLNRNSYNEFVSILENETFDILYFDGHGVFGKMCSRCKAMNFPHQVFCQSNECNSLLPDDPQGFLVFEDQDKKADYVDADTIGHQLMQTGIQLAYLSACKTSTVAGHSAFNSISGSLILAGVPSVISMQFSISLASAYNFAEAFYDSFLKSRNLEEGVALARKRLIRKKEFFIPTLYIRKI